MFSHKTPVVANWCWEQFHSLLSAPVTTHHYRQCCQKKKQNKNAMMVASRLRLVAFFFALAYRPAIGFVTTSRSQVSSVDRARSTTPTNAVMSQTQTLRYSTQQQIMSRRQSSLKLGMWSNDEELRGTDRFKACVPYILPLLDGDKFGQYIYERIPPLGLINEVTVGPLAEIYRNIPFLGVGLFVALTLGTRFNTDMDRTVRFNAQQAAMIDVALILPELISSGFEENPVPRYLTEPCANFVWYAYMSAVLYSIVMCLRGRKPDQIPYISPWAELMVGPF